MEKEERTEEVMSEVHLGCPPHLSGPYISHFTISLPSPRCSDQVQMGVSSKEVINLDNYGEHDPKNQKRCSFEHDDSEPSSDHPRDDISGEFLCLDKDGDLILTRRKNHNRLYAFADRCMSFGLTIQHSITSSLLEVGLQVWKAALILTDFILHKSFITSDLNDIIGIELGAGTGLVGIILARVARTVFITDKGLNILDNCHVNTHLNSSLLKFHESSVRVRELDWKDSWPPNVTIDLPTQDRSTESRYLWSPFEIEEAESATILLAADVIYSDELTDSFFSVVEKLMSRGFRKVLYLALEKRYNFSIDELDVVANGYSHFRRFFRDDDEEQEEHCDEPGFVGKRIDLSEIPYYIREYDRGKDLEMWKITYRRNE